MTSLYPAARLAERLDWQVVEPAVGVEVEGCGSLGVDETDGTVRFVVGPMDFCTLEVKMAEGVSSVSARRALLRSRGQ